ncbi:MAG TPA: alpha/beta hydrolase-fold protein [Candidatus Sulfotelmatobacter sp.]|nr:alpha/beta hydrolase-fold protein [Candidatus Sulfotelmatobacter sp.]
MLQRITPLLAIVTVLATSALAAQKKPAAKPAGERFEISFPKEMSAGPLDGHVLLLISNNGEKEPRFQISFMVAKSQQAFGVDVDALQPGTPAIIDASTVGYPAETLNDVPAGDYWVQGLLNIYETFHLGNGRTLKLPPDKGEGQHWQVKPGNFYSKPVKMHLDPKLPQTVRISLTEKIPAVEDEPKVVDSIVGWDASNDDHVIRDNKWVKHLRMQSELLTKFWGRPTYLGAVVLLPDRWEEHPDAHYPLIVEHDHFHRGLPGVVSFRTEPPGENLKGGELRQAQNGYKLYQDWTAGRLPRVIVLSIQHATPYFDDSYAVNSENVGPYGDAIIQELIPYVEKQFRGIGQGWARAVYGGSTGGWESLASQVFYPDFYNGAWVFCPDVVDFRAYMTMNLYDDSNAFWIDGIYGNVPRPSVRQPDGLVLSTMEQMNRYEYVFGTHSRSGEQLDTWQAVFSSVGDDGYPKPVFNKRTGEIDHETAKYWKEHYDLSAIMQRDWKTLGPKLAGKLHLYVGEADTFYLDRAVHLLKDFMDTTTDPYYHGSFEFGVRKPHCYPGEYDPAVGLNQHYWPEMVKHMEETAPAGADLKSWKY